MSEGTQTVNVAERIFELEQKYQQLAGFINEIATNLNNVSKQVAENGEVLNNNNKVYVDTFKTINENIDNLQQKQHEVNISVADSLKGLVGAIKEMNQCNKTAIEALIELNQCNKTAIEALIELK